MGVMTNDVRRVLERTPAILRGLIEGAPADAIDFHERDGAWSPTQVLAHLTDGETTDWMPRLKVMVSSAEDRSFTPFDREGGFRRYAGWTSSELLREFEQLRAANLADVDAMRLTDVDRQRTAVHPELGVVTLSHLLACWSTHDLGHIAQVTRSLVRQRGPGVGPWRKYFSLLSD